MKLSLAISFLFTANAFANAGLTVDNGRTIADRIVMERVTYTGTCPGTEMAKQEAKFMSLTTDPAPGLRVVVTNITPGLDDSPLPYTDREYYDGVVSERTFLLPNDEHKGKTFSVVEGENRFQYVIKDGRRIVETGTFSTDIVLNEKTLTRNRYPDYKWVCGPHEWDRSCRLDTRWRCVVEPELDY